MSSINLISSHIPSFVMTTDSGRVLSETTIQRLLALGIDPTTITTETEAQIKIAQAEAARNQENSQDGGKNQEKQKEELQQNIFNTMDMMSISNKLILGL